MSVLVPTWRRPTELQRCIDGLARQARVPEETLIVVREDDLATHATVEALAARHPSLALRMLSPSAPGLGAALNAGLEGARSDIVCCTDDDAVPRPDWLARIAKHFDQDPGLGGVGGLDVNWPRDDHARPAGDVGRVLPFGRIVGNHHLGTGRARTVDILKGANMSYRRKSIGGLRFDSLLHGTGSQPHNEVGFCLRLASAGWRLLYDPAVVVDHYPAVRLEDQRASARTGQEIRVAAHNQFYGLLQGLHGSRRAPALAYQLLLGSREDPGPVLGFERFVRGREGMPALRRSLAATTGRLEAFRTRRRSDQAHRRQATKALN